jgi:hypothetical protein
MQGKCELKTVNADKLIVVSNVRHGELPNLDSLAWLAESLLPELRTAADLSDFSRGQRDPLFTCGEGDSLDSIISTQDNSEDDHKDARYSAGEDTGDIKHQRISGYMMET